MTKKLGWLLPAFLSLVFLSRVCFFAAEYGGVEHDSGWILGVIKNIAYRGVYAGYTNLSFEEGQGVFPSIHGRTTIQDEQGLTYVPEMAVGPGFMFPQALILKVFGNGWWTYRAWGLATYFGLMLMLFRFALCLGGGVALGILAVWLWVLPPLYFNLAYETLAEPTALFYLLMSSFFFEGRAALFVSGLFLGLSIETKLVFAVAAPAFFGMLTRDVLKRDTGTQLAARQALFFSLGMTVPFFLELPHYFHTWRAFGFEALQVQLKDSMVHFVGHGSGIAELMQRKGVELGSKLSIWIAIGIHASHSFWIVFIAAAVYLIRSASRERRFQVIVLVSLAGLFHSWFVFINPTGWTRHAWPGLLLSMVIISAALGGLLSTKTPKRGVILTLLLIYAFSIFDFNRLTFAFSIDPKAVDEWQGRRHQDGGLAAPCIPIFPLSEQKAVVHFFNAEVEARDRVYYHQTLLVAEVSGLVDKVFYPLGRYERLERRNPEGGRSLLILGPYQKGNWPWQLVDSGYVQRVSSELCQKTLFESRSYLVCELKVARGQ